MKSVTLFFLILVTLASFSQAVLDWNNYSGSNTDKMDFISEIAIDLQGNCYATGTQNLKMRVIKYSNAGFEAWSKEFTGNWPFEAYGICTSIDKNGNLIASGTVIDTPQSYNILLLKINKSTGDTIWGRHYNTSGFNYEERTRKMEVDTLGNIYIAAHVKPNSNSSDYLILKYSSNGALLWNKTYSYSSRGVNFCDGIKDMKLDEYMNVYVFGYNTETISIDTIRHNTVVKYNKDGVFQWAATYYVSSAQSEILAGSVDADAQGNVYISGSKHLLTNGWGEFYLIKYNSSGIKQWTILYGGDASEGIYGGGVIKLDNAGNIVLTSTLQTNNGSDCKTFKYNSAGTLIWSNISSLSDRNIAQSLQIKPSGEIYIGGVFINQNSSIYKTGVIKLSTWGSTQWGVTYTGNGSQIKDVNDMKLFNNDIFLAGSERMSALGPLASQCLTQKFVEQVLRPQNSYENIPKYFELSQNYPNPFNPVTDINYSLAKDARVMIVVYDILGRETRVLIDELKSAGSYSLKFDGSNLASGVYYYKITAGDFTDFKKMILVK